MLRCTIRTILPHVYFVLFGDGGAFYFDIRFLYIVSLFTTLYFYRFLWFSDFLYTQRETLAGFVIERLL